MNIKLQLRMSNSLRKMSTLPYQACQSCGWTRIQSSDLESLKGLALCQFFRLTRQCQDSITLRCETCNPKWQPSGGKFEIKGCKCCATSGERECVPEFRRVTQPHLVLCCMMTSFERADSCTSITARKEKSLFNNAGWAWFNRKGHVIHPTCQLWALSFLVVSLWNMTRCFEPKV